jgi:hypothetical protein
LSDTVDDIAAMLRSEAGRNPHDKQFIKIIGELSTRSETFRTRWAAHNVRFHRIAHKRIRHPVVGLLELDFEAMELPSQPGLTLLVYTAAPNPRPPTAWHCSPAGQPPPTAQTMSEAKSSSSAVKLAQRYRAGSAAKDCATTSPKSAGRRCNPHSSTRDHPRHQRALRLDARPTRRRRHQLAR